METKGKNWVPSGTGIFFLDLSIWCKTYHVRVLLQKTHLVHKPKWLYQNLTSMHQNFLWRCQFTTSSYQNASQLCFLVHIVSLFFPAELLHVIWERKWSWMTFCPAIVKWYCRVNLAYYIEHEQRVIKSTERKMLFSCKKLLTILLGHEGYTRFDSLIAYKKNNKKTEKNSSLHHISFFHHTLQSRHCQS